MRKNFRSDISIRESFYDYDQSGERIPSLVPENVRIEYFTPAYPRVRLVCSRYGDTFHNCSLSENGRVLVCNLALSRKSLGVGPLLKIVKNSVADSPFPYNFQNKEHIASTGIDLWGGPSDAGELESESVLSEVILRYGYSAYRLAVLDGFKGTEQEWLESLIGNGIQSVMQTQTSQESDGENIVTVTMTDGTQAQFTIHNGKQGKQGLQGIPGVANAKYKEVDELPTASAETLDFIFLVASETEGLYDMYYTEQDGNTYEWKLLGDTAIQLADYAKKTDMNKIVGGGTIAEMVYDHSAFAAAQVQLPETITLSQVGDFVEFKVKASTDKKAILKHVAAYQPAQIAYSSQNTFGMRLTGLNGENFSYNGTYIAWETVHVFKLVLSSIVDGTRNFTLYVDGTARTPVSTAPNASADVVFSLAGSDSGSTMDLYYVKGKSAGVDFYYEKFATYTVNTGTVEDVETAGRQTVLLGLERDEANIAALQTAMTRTGEAIEQVAGDMDDLEDEALNGGEMSTYNHSTFTAESRNIPVSIGLSQAGDYLEMKVKQTNDSGAILFASDDPYQSRRIDYYAENTLRFRFEYSTSTGIFNYKNEAVKRGQVQIIRVELTAISEGTYTYTFYLDGSSIGTLDTGHGVTFDTLGRNIAMDLYYLKNKSAGVLTEYTHFAEMEDAAGVTDVIDAEEYMGLREMTQEVKQLDKRPRMFYTFTKASTIWDCHSHFVVYQQIAGNKYAGFIIGLYQLGKSNSNPDALSYLWRIIRVLEFEYNGITMSPTGNVLIAYGESEFVMRQTSPAKTDFTGGYHGDETFDVTGGFAEFYIDNVLTAVPAADVPLTECKAFYYHQRAALYETNNSDEGDDASTVGTTFGWHVKKTTFLNGGYRTENRVDFTRQIPFYAYMGIVCTDRWASDYARGELDPLTAMGTGTPVQTQQFLAYGTHEILYQNAIYQTTVSSRVDFGDDDSKNQLVVYNATQYNKFYRRTQDIAGVDKIAGETTVEIKPITTE